MRSRAIGIDVERVRADFAGLEIAERFFSPDEATALRAVAPARRAEAFLTCWTLKET